MDSDEKLATINKVKQEAAAYLLNGDLVCSEAVFAAVNNHLGNILDGNMIRISSGFAGGIGAMGSTCGALCGGILALGLNSVKTGEDNISTIRLSRRLFRDFSNKYEKTTCKLLTEGLEKGTPEQISHCSIIVGDTVEMVLNLIAADNY